MLRAIVLASFVGFAAVADEGPQGDGQGNGAMMHICAPLEEQLAFLKKKFNEEVVFVGKSEVAHGVSMVTASPSGSWTMLFSRQGLMCAASAGVGFKITPPGTDT